MRERLPVVGAATAAKLARPWGGVDLGNLVAVAAQAAGCTGTPLPFVRIAGNRLCPVVIWDHDLLEHRIRTGHPPELDRQVLQDRLCNDIDHWVPAALQMEAFIAVGPLCRARTGLGLIAGVARPISAVPAVPAGDAAEGRGRDLDETLCDFYGFDLVEIGSAAGRITTARHRVTGRGSPKHPAGGVAHQRRLMEEQLFDVAQRTQTVPTPARNPR